MGMIQCAKCACTLYFTEEGGASGLTGELCYNCQKEKDDDYYDWDEDDC